VELFYESSGPDIGSRLAEQMQSRRGNHSETWLRCVSTASTLHWLRVEWWRHRRRRRRHRGKINSRDGRRRLPHQFHFARERDTILAVPIKQTHVVHPSRAEYPRLSPGHNSATSTENQFANRSVRMCVGLTGVGSNSHSLWHADRTIHGIRMRIHPSFTSKY